MTATPWERFWYRPTPLLRLALFRVAVAWLCLYDAFLYDPTALLHQAATFEGTWNPLVAFQLLGIRPTTPETSAAVALAYRISALFVLAGFRTRTACAVMALLAFWQGGMAYSLTKMRHDRVALFFATFALVFAPAGARLSIDARLRSPKVPPGSSPQALWPILLTQTSIAIGYSAAGLTKLLHSGWLNGYTLQGIILGHRGAYADLVVSSPALCQLMSFATVFAEFLCPLCLFWRRPAFLFVPTLISFHWATWATMDTGPYMTLWFLLVAFVPLDLVRPFLRERWRNRQRWLVAVACTWASLVVGVIAWVMQSVVPLPWLAAAVIATAAAIAQRPVPIAAPAPLR